jgi:hypothetical protein
MKYLLSCVLVIGALGASSELIAANRILSRLEKGEVVSTKTGSSFFVQAIINQESDKVATAFSDLTKLPTIFPQVAIARPYVGSDGRQFIYLKLRGLGDGLGILAEVKNASSESFVNAKELVMSSEVNPSRDSSAEVDISNDPSDLQLRREIDEANQGTTDPIFVGASSGIIMEGPFNEIIELPGVRMTVHLGYASYTSLPPATLVKGRATVATTPTRKTYMVAKVSFGNQTSREYLGDYRGFGERRLSLATLMGVNALEALRATLEKM